VGGLLQTDPQERAKTSTASSGCRPRPTAPDPVVRLVLRAARCGRVMPQPKETNTRIAEEI